VLLNAAAGLYVSDQEPTFEQGVERATAALRSGAGRAALERLRSAAPGRGVDVMKPIDILSP